MARSSGRRTPKIKMSVTYQYAFGVEQQRALHILAMMLGAAAERCRQQQMPQQLEKPPEHPTSNRQVPDQFKLLRFCVTPRALREMLSCMGLKDRETFMANRLHPLLEEKLLTMTDPDSRRSPRQKYVTTPNGLEAIVRKGPKEFVLGYAPKGGGQKLTETHRKDNSKKQLGSLLGQTNEIGLS